MKQIGSPTTLGAHGFKGRRRVGLRPTPKYLRRTQSPQARKKPLAPSVISDEPDTIPLFCSSSSFFTHSHNWRYRSGQSRNSILLNAEKQNSIIRSPSYYAKVLLKRFYLNDHIIGFRPQTQKLESPWQTP